MTSVIALFFATLALTSTAALGLRCLDLAEQLDGLEADSRRQERIFDSWGASVDLTVVRLTKELAALDGRVSDLKVSHESAVEWLEELQHSTQSVLVAARRFGLALMPDDESEGKAPVVR